MESVPLAAALDRVLGESVIPDGRDEGLAAVEANHRAGATVTSVNLGHASSVEEYLDKLDAFGSEVISQYR